MSQPPQGMLHQPKSEDHFEMMHQDEAVHAMLQFAMSSAQNQASYVLHDSTVKPNTIGTVDNVQSRQIVPMDFGISWQTPYKEFLSTTKVESLANEPDAYVNITASAVYDSGSVQTATRGPTNSDKPNIEASISPCPGDYVQSSVQASYTGSSNTIKPRKPVIPRKGTPIEGRTFVCSVCNAKFALRHHLKEHENIHTDKYQCPICEKRFCTQRALRYHVERVPHDRNREPMKDSKYVAVMELLDKQDSDVAAEHANNTVLGKSKRSMCTCETCGVVIQERSLAHHRLTHTSEPVNRAVICETCGHEFTNNSSLALHQKTHQREAEFQRKKALGLFVSDKPYHCSKCGYGTWKISELNRHVATVHVKDDKRFLCSVCDSLFHSERKLNLHHRRVHNADRRFACTKCEAKFKVRSHLTEHIEAVHLRLKPHSCDRCERSFTKIQDLRRHIKLMHENPKRTTSICEYCSSPFATIKSLTRHITAEHPEHAEKFAEKVKITRKAAATNGNTKKKRKRKYAENELENDGKPNDLGTDVDDRKISMQKLPVTDEPSVDLVNIAQKKRKRRRKPDSPIRIVLTRSKGSEKEATWEMSPRPSASPASNDDIS